MEGRGGRGGGYFVYVLEMVLANPVLGGLSYDWYTTVLSHGCHTSVLSQEGKHAKKMSLNCISYALSKRRKIVTKAQRLKIYYY